MQGREGERLYLTACRMSGVRGDRVCLPAVVVATCITDDRFEWRICLSTRRISGVYLAATAVDRILLTASALCGTTRLAGINTGAK